MDESLQISSSVKNPNRLRLVFIFTSLSLSGKLQKKSERGSHGDARVPLSHICSETAALSSFLLPP